MDTSALSRDGKTFTVSTGVPLPNYQLTFRCGLSQGVVVGCFLGGEAGALLFTSILELCLVRVPWLHWLLLPSCGEPLISTMAVVLSENG